MKFNIFLANVKTFKHLNEIFRLLIMQTTDVGFQREPAGNSSSNGIKTRSHDDMPRWALRIGLTTTPRVAGRCVRAMTFFCVCTSPHHIPTVAITWRSCSRAAVQCKKRCITNTTGERTANNNNTIIQWRTCRWGDDGGGIEHRHRHRIWVWN